MRGDDRRHKCQEGCGEERGKKTKGPCKKKRIASVTQEADRWDSLEGMSEKCERNQEGQDKKKINDPVYGGDGCQQVFYLG